MAFNQRSKHRYLTPAERNGAQLRLEDMKPPVGGWPPWYRFGPICGTGSRTVYEHTCTRCGVSYEEKRRPSEDVGKSRAFAESHMDCQKREEP